MLASEIHRTPETINTYLTSLLAGFIIINLGWALPGYLKKRGLRRLK